VQKGATIVLGAGVIGVTTAYYLAKAGRKVIVIDRQDDVARETSFANAGLVAPGHSYTWASPRAPKILLKSLFLPDQALRLKLSFDPQMWRWCWRFWQNCTAEPSALNTGRKVRLNIYSQAKLNELVARERLEYDQVSKGLLYCYRDQASFDTGAANAGILRKEGLEVKPVDWKQAIAIEPALAGSREPMAGALFAPSDASGDSRKFTTGLAARCRALGVEFMMNTEIRALEHAGDEILGVQTSKGRIAGADYVLALGCYSPALARPLDYRIPVYPIKGYSLTFPIEAARAASAPSVGGVDENNLVAWARFGDRFRLTAIAEFSGFDLTHRPSNFAHMKATAQSLFPRAADYDSPSYWACLRPMTPEGTPVLGRTRHRNLYLNTGHGHMGWTMACGASKVVVDLMNGAKPEIPLDGMVLEKSDGGDANFL
jgi:D-amino-acid dehydrogenase